MNVAPPGSRSILLLVMSATLGLTAGRASSQLDSLLARSPFEPAKSSQPADTGNQSVEFRGVLEENGERIFSIHDTVTKHSRWVTLNDTGGDLVVKSYDAETRTVSLEQNGRTLALALKSGPRIAQQNIPQPMPRTSGQPSQIMPSGAAQGIDPLRIQQMTAEIQRRRAARQQPPLVPAPNGMPRTGAPVPTGMPK